MTNRLLFKLVGTAMLSAVAFILMLLEFPLLPAAPYLKMDFGDIPCLLSGIVFGPGYGVLTELFKNILELLIRGFGSQLGFGNLQNFIVGCAFILPFSFMVHSKRQNHLLHLIVSSAAACAVMLIFGFASNYVVAPLFFRFFLNQPLSGNEAFAAASISIPFNAIKGALISFIIILLWKPLVEKLQQKFGTPN